MPHAGVIFKVEQIDDATKKRVAMLSYPKYYHFLYGVWMLILALVGLAPFIIVPIWGATHFPNRILFFCLLGLASMVSTLTLVNGCISAIGWRIASPRFRDFVRFKQIQSGTGYVIEQQIGVLIKIGVVGSVVLSGVVFGYFMATKKPAISYRMIVDEPAGQTVETPPNGNIAEQAILEIDGHGFFIGDIVSFKKELPTLGDVVLYDIFENESDCLYMGPNTSLGKIVGIPGEHVTFKDNVMYINDRPINLSQDNSKEKAAFASGKYDGLVSETITLQPDEYLIDEKIGTQCFRDNSSQSGSIWYNRFTVVQKAVIGVIDKKIGYDDAAETELRSRVY